MSGIYNTVYSCLVKKPISEQTEVVTDPDEIKENEAPELYSDKKTDVITDPSAQPGMIWRLSSGVYNTCSSTVGYGIGGIKWVASKSYDVTATVAGKVKEKVPFKGTRKDKKE